MCTLRVSYIYIFTAGQLHVDRVASVGSQAMEVDDMQRMQEAKGRIRQAELESQERIMKTKMAAEASFRTQTADLMRQRNDNNTVHQPLVEAQQETSRQQAKLDMKLEQFAQNIATLEQRKQALETAAQQHSEADHQQIAQQQQRLEEQKHCIEQKQREVTDYVKQLDDQREKQRKQQAELEVARKALEEKQAELLKQEESLSNQSRAGDETFITNANTLPGKKRRLEEESMSEDQSLPTTVSSTDDTQQWLSMARQLSRPTSPSERGKFVSQQANDLSDVEEGKDDDDVDDDVDDEVDDTEE